jgi:hypothetical protein
MAAEAVPQSPQGPPANVTVDGKTYPSLADGEYDVIVLGTGLKEVLLAGMLAKEQGKRVRFEVILLYCLHWHSYFDCIGAGTSN